MVCPRSLVRTIKNSSYRDRERYQRRYNHHGYHGYHHYYCCCLYSFSTFHWNRESSHETFSSVFSWIQRYSQTTVATSAPSTMSCTTTLGNSLLQPVQPVAALKLCSITTSYTQQFYKCSPIDSAPLPVQAVALASIRVRSTEFEASQQPHGILPVQRVQRVTAGNQTE